MRNGKSKVRELWISWVFENRECRVKNIAPFLFVVQSISVYGLESVQSCLHSFVRFVVGGIVRRVKAKQVHCQKALIEANRGRTLEVSEREKVAVYSERS